jgi:hypothetical protein
MNLQPLRRVVPLKRVHVAWSPLQEPPPFRVGEFQICAFILEIFMCGEYYAGGFVDL